MSSISSKRLESSKDLLHIYNKLLGCYGKQHWWPADTRDEIIIGAILTQNTRWHNVSKAIVNLKENHLCSLTALAEEDSKLIADLIKPAGYYNVKAARLQNIARLLKEWQPSKLEIGEARKFLLSLKGIGPETADSILLYAYDIPSFVIDTYTIRLFSRVILLPEKKNYSFYQEFFMENLDRDPVIYNEYHALIVQHAKSRCQKVPLCDQCPLSQLCLFPAENKKKQSDYLK